MSTKDTSSDELRNYTGGGQQHPYIEQPLSGQQMQALQKDMAARLTAITKDVELRKWAVDQACGLAGAAYEGNSTDPVDVEHLARSIHAFLTEGAKE